MKRTLVLKQPIIYLLIVTAFLGVLASCKKGTSSANHVVFSFNDSLKATCWTDIRPNFDFLGGPNCEFQFDRMGKYVTGESAEIGFFVEYLCDLKTAPLPYQTQYFSVTIIVYPHAWDPIIYNYAKGIPPDTARNTSGNLTLTITSRETNLVRGTIKGTIWSSLNDGNNYYVPFKFDCSFDLAIPVIK